MRILIIKTSSLGDVIHALPVIAYLHRAFPAVELGWVVEAPFSDLLSGNPLLTRLHLINTRAWRKSPLSDRTRQEVSTLWRELRGGGYDLLLDLQGNLKSGIIGLLTGINRRIGFPRQLLQEPLNRFCTTEKALYSLEDNHASLRCLSIAAVAAGLPYRDEEPVSDIAVGEADRQQAEAVLRGVGSGKRLLFHCGTTWQTKFWTVDGWSRLGTQVCRTFPGSTILLTYGSDIEQEMACQVASCIEGNTRLVERLPLKTLAALMKQVDLVAGGDTGPVHLAAAVGTPTVSLYRSSDGSESGPRGSQHVIVQSPLSCTRCFRTSCSQDDECRASITVEAMFAGIERLLRADGAVGLTS
ncbi:MAG: lipopolysaccharide heptosyltransferase I [Geobacter sp.]|nr:lipopolysaccharide heptosyltransferase I [Geobacter sp.]